MARKPLLTPVAGDPASGHPRSSPSRAPSRGGSTGKRDVANVWKHHAPRGREQADELRSHAAQGRPAPVAPPPEAPHADQGGASTDAHTPALAQSGVHRGPTLARTSACLRPTPPGSEYRHSYRPGRLWIRCDWSHGHTGVNSRYHDLNDLRQHRSAVVGWRRARAAPARAADAATCATGNEDVAAG